MASSIKDPYYFLPEAEAYPDIFSSSSIFCLMDFEDSETKSSKSENSKYDFYNHIQTIHLDEETLSKLAPHQQPSKFIWATSFQISEQSFLFGIFTTFGIIVWKCAQQYKSSSDANYSEFYRVKPVEKQMATFIDCINSQSLIFTYKDEKILYAIHNVMDNQGEESNEIIKKCDISNTIRAFCQISPEKALIITDNSIALIFDVPSLTKLKAVSYNSILSPIFNPILKINPIRSQNICDSIILTTLTDYDEENGENDNYIVSASYYHLSIFDNSDSKSGNFALKNAIKTAIGTPKYVSAIGTSAFLMILNEQDESEIVKPSDLTFLQITDIYDKQTSPPKKIDLFSNENVVAVIAIENDVCCVLTRYHLHLIIVSDITFQFSLVVSKSPNDFIFIGSLISDHTLSVMTAHEGNHIFEILPYAQLLRLIPYQANRVLASLSLFQTENEKHGEKSDFHDSVSILERCDIDEEAFYETDRQKILSLNHYKMMPDFLKIHFDLVKLFYIYASKKYKDKGQDDEDIKSELKSINEFEINAYNLICFKETISYVGDSTSFEFDVLKNAIKQRNLQIIFDSIRSDISTHHYSLLDFLIGMVDSCFKEHFIPNQNIYLSTLRCHPEVKNLVDEALRSFKGHSKSIAEHLEQYTKLCSLSFSIFDGEGEEENKKYYKQIDYAMELFNLDDEYRERAIDCAEKIAFDHAVIELMARILHETQLYNNKCNLYYDNFGSFIVMPILIYMLNKEWIADIFDIGEIPEWRPYVYELLTNSDSLLLAFHLITEDGEELARAADLLWKSIRNGISKKIFSIDQAASLCSIALMCCTFKLNEDPDKFSYLLETKQNAQDQFMLLELQKTSRIGDNIVMKPDELIDYFIGQKDYVVALSVYACSINERNEQQNAKLLADIISLLAVTWKNPLNDGSLQQILVESKALVNIPNGLFDNLERSISQDEKRNLVYDIVRAANQQSINS